MAGILTDHNMLNDSMDFLSIDRGQAQSNKPANSERKFLCVYVLGYMR